MIIYAKLCVILTIDFIEDFLNFLYRYLRETYHTLVVMLFGGSNLVGLILQKVFQVILNSGHQFQGRFKKPCLEKNTPLPLEAMLFNGSKFNLVIFEEGHPGNTFL